MTGQKEINQLFDYIDESKLTLSDRINFHDDGDDKIHVIDEEAVTPSMKRLYSSYSSYDIFEWLKVSGYLKR